MNPKQKAKDLIELASDERAGEKERMSAAVKACALIRKHDLLSSPFDGFLASDNETVKAASSIFDRLTDPELMRDVKKVAGRFKRRR